MAMHPQLNSLIPNEHHHNQNLHAYAHGNHLHINLQWKKQKTLKSGFKNLILIDELKIIL
jgi:hypothetical protein